MSRDRGLALRERILAVARSHAPEAGVAILAELDALARDEVALGEMTTELRGLVVSDLPTPRFRALRFVEARELEPAIRDRFVRPSPTMPELAAVFVDPEEFCFRNFEHILPLDRLFEDLGSRCLRALEPEELAPDIVRVPLRPSKDLRARLEQLDELGLYTPPSNPGSRGGRRFIFHSAELAEALGRTLRRRLPKSILAGFRHVNPVFRCNRFEPNDAGFAAHLDAPYSDQAHGLVSKYTLLVYLSGGQSQAVLRFGEGEDDESAVVVGSSAQMDAFVFRQDRVHEGRPYVEGAKIFLRTELIYADEDLGCEPAIAATFAKACYLDGQALRCPELEPHAARAYERAAAARWRGGIATCDEPEPFVHKRFAGCEFVTNGFDFWFDRRALSLVEGAALTLLDALNARVDGTSFRKRYETRTITRKPGRDASARAWIAELLDGARPQDPPFGRFEREHLIPEPEHPEEGMSFPSSPDFSPDPFPGRWDATRHPRVVRAYAGARRWSLERIFAAPIMMLGHELYWQPDHFIVGADKIHVLSKRRLDPVHFAGAVWYAAEDFIGSDYSIAAPELLVPPISYRSEGGLWRLSFDLFRNSWMVSHEERTVPVPRVIDDPEAIADTSP